MGNILRILFSAGDNGNNEYAHLEHDRRETRNGNYYYKFDTGNKSDHWQSNSSNTNPNRYHHTQFDVESGASGRSRPYNYTPDNTPNIFSGQTKPTYYDQSYVRTNVSASSVPAKPVSYSSNTGPDRGEFGGFRSNNPPITGSPTPSNIKDAKEAEKGGTERYDIPKHIEGLVKNEIVPPVLKKPLSPDTYADYFAALLYAEDFYCEKWSDYLLKDVALNLREKENPGLQNHQHDRRKSKKHSDLRSTQNSYPYVVFKIEDVPERRPFLLSRDRVHLRPVNKSKDSEPFHGVLLRVEKSTTILAEFEDDFHRQHEPSKKYDVSFSFNRVCLKRAHRAVSAASNPLLRQILFPNRIPLPAQRSEATLMEEILSNKFAPIPYLIEGPLSHNKNGNISDMLIILKVLVVKIYESRNDNRVLICAPTNRACDSFMRLVMKEVPEFDLFRANAAFRDKELVPDDIMQASIFRGECFTCPSLEKLKKFRIITSTFVSAFRLYSAGLKAGHFSHIFLVDASSAMEPEAIVALADLVSGDTVVVVTGSMTDRPNWIRSDIGRRHGLKKSFFERLLENEPYKSDNPHFITHIEES